MAKAKSEQMEENENAAPVSRVIKITDLIEAQQAAFKSGDHTAALALVDEYRAIAGDTDFAIRLRRTLA